MANDFPEYRKVTITSLPNSNGEFDIKDIRRDLDSIVNNAIKSALPKNAFFKVSDKQLMPNGQMSVNVYVHKDSAYLTEESIRQQAGALTFKGSIDPRYAVSSMSDVDNRTTQALFREEFKEDKENKRFNRGTFLKIVGLVTAVADIARRILSAVTAMSQQTVKDMITANNLSMPYDAVRGYRHTETAHGMKEGTIVGGIADIQKMFGNITALDEKSLEALAVVMGGEIKEAIDMGLGSSNPEKVLGMILDKFNEQANAGINSIGQQVGEVQARRELYSYLLRISPQIADIFATMQEEQHNVNSIWRGNNTFAEWRNAFPTERNVTPAQRNASATAGQEWNLAQETLAQIKESLQLSLVPAVLRIARWISNNRAFMSETEKARLNQENYAKNEAFIQSAEMTISAIESNGNLTDAQKTRVKLLKEAVKNARAMNESGGDNITFEGYETTMELQLAVENDLRAQQRGKAYLANNAGRKGAVSFGDEFALGFSDDEIARILAGHPNKESQLRAEYENAIKDQDEAYRKAKKDAENNRAEVERGQLLYLQSQNTDANRIANAQVEQAKLLGAGNVASTKALKQVRKAGIDTTLDTSYRDLLVIQSLFPGFDPFHDDRGKELSYKDAIQRVIDLGYAQRSRFGYGLDIIKPLPAVDMESLKSQANAYAWEKVPNVFPPEVIEGFYQWAFKHDPLFFNSKGLSYQTEDKIKASYTDEGNALYELTHGVWGQAMQAVAQSLATGSYNGNAKVRFSSKDVVDDSGVIQHKFMFSIMSDGKTIAKDVPIETVTTGALWGDHPSLMSVDMNVNNGKITTNSLGTEASMLK